MKKFIFIAMLFVLLGTSSPAMAAPWSAALLAAVNSGNTGQINAIAAAHPEAQGDMAIVLLLQVQEKLATNPELAAKIFAATGPFVPQITGPNSPNAADILIKIIQTAKDGNFQQKDCRGALTILGAALSMSSMPNIVTASPNLHAVALSAANDALESNPTCDTKELQDQVSLAQAPTPPTTGAQGAVAPSAD